MQHLQLVADGLVLGSYNCPAITLVGFQLLSQYADTRFLSEGAVFCSFWQCVALISVSYYSSEYHEITSFLRSSLARCCPTRQLFHVFLLWCAVTAKCLEKLIWATAALGVINLSKYKVQFPWSCHRRSPYSYNHPQPELGCVSLNLFHFTQNNQIFIMWVSVCVAVAEGLGCSPGRWETLFPVTAPMNI